MYILTDIFKLRALIRTNQASFNRKYISRYIYIGSTKRPIISVHQQKCNFATITGLHRNLNEAGIEDPEWPVAKYPTPYEIFGVKSINTSHLPKKELNKLKKKYHKYVKLYHPDIALSKNIVDSINKDNFLSADEKINRFRMISLAYEILTTPHKKSTYDLTRSNWTHNSPSTINNVYSMNHNASNFNNSEASEYWHAGTWEDVNNFNSRYGDHKNPTQDNNNRFVYYWAFGMLVCIEGSALLTKVQDSLNERAEYLVTEEDIQRGIFQAYENYGLDDDKFSRIKRFLWFRSWGLYNSKEDLDREAKTNEELLNTIMELEDSIKVATEKDSDILPVNDTKEVDAEA